VIHTGRPWFAFWLVPYPSTLRLWPQFKSPLVWDVFAVTTYLTVSFLFWYTGLVPDLAAMRDASQSRARRIVYGIFALGWRGSGRQWHNWNSTYYLLAGLSTPLVLSVHTIVSFDFAVALLPGWHTTIFPPYFVAGAIFSGFAMVLTLIIPARRFLGLKHVITLKHLENMTRFLLATGWMVTFGYAMETFIAWYSGDPFEMAIFDNRRTGAYAGVYWLLVFCNVLSPQVFWWRKARLSIPVMWTVSVLINIGMWCERFIIVVQSLHHDFQPSSWAIYKPTWVDWSLYIGTLCFFASAFLLFLRFVPAVPASEVKELNHELRGEAHGEAAHG
jgi:molybdopterin-containing oxidoreductase family membrane subunit